jgi:hypothetical protein
MPDIFDSSKQRTSKQPEIANTIDESSIEEKPLVDTNNAYQPPTLPKARRHVDEYSEIMRQSSPSSSLFDSFVAKPIDVSFDSQLDNEYVILLVRKHPITQLKYVAGAVLLILMPMLFSYIKLFGFFPARYQFAALIFWFMLISGYILESFLNWFFNCNIITDERVIDVDFESLIYKNISAAKLDNVEDITATTGGAVRSMFDFGTIKIQTAAATTEFEFEDVPHPAKITTLLNELLLEEEREKVEGRVN